MCLCIGLSIHPGGASSTCQTCDAPSSACSIGCQSETPVRSHPIRPSQTNGASGLRERRFIFSTYIGASVHPMSLKTLSVCTRWVYLRSVLHPMSTKTLSVCMRWDYLRSIIAPDVSRQNESRLMMHNARWAMLGAHDFTSLMPLRGYFRFYFDYEVRMARR